MAAPIIPIIKKVAAKIGSAVASDKRGRKVILWIVGIVLFLLLMPIIALLAIFNSGIDTSFKDVNDMLKEQQIVAEATMTEIERQMLDEGYTELKIEEAQALYTLVLFDRGKEENFVERYVACFDFEQTDEELIDNVNAEFGTTVKAQEYTDVVQEIRDKYANQENEEET